MTATVPGIIGAAFKGGKGGKPSGNGGGSSGYGGGSGGHGSYSYGSGYDSAPVIRNIPSLFYAVVYAILLVTALVLLALKSRRSYTSLFTILACVLGVVADAIDATMVPSTSTNSVHVVFIMLLLVCVVHFTMESARSSAVTAGKKPSYCIAIYCLAAFSDVLAIIQAGLYGAVALSPNRTTVVSATTARAVFLLLVILVCLGLWCVGLATKGMSVNHKWTIPTCLAFLFFYWIFLICVAALHYKIPSFSFRQVFRNYFTRNIWGGLPPIIVLFILIVFWKPNRGTNKHHDAYSLPLNAPYSVHSNVPSNLSKPGSFSSQPPAMLYQHTHQVPYQQQHASYQPQSPSFQQQMAHQQQQPVQMYSTGPANP